MRLAVHNIKVCENVCLKRAVHIYSIFILRNSDIQQGMTGTNLQLKWRKKTVGVAVLTAGT